jgi:hypothetical protein
MILDEDNKPRVLFSPEAPEILFEDYGTSQLINGEAYVEIDSVLKKALYIDEKHPLKVFIQLEGDCAGVFVTDKSVDGFRVKELARGTSNVKFSWHIVANRADDMDSLGNVTSEHVGLRLPYGPIPIKETPMVKRDFKISNGLSMN